jgi:hypothetical protein
MAGQDLTGNQISTTYKSILKTTDNAEIDASGQTRITDGKGNDTSLSLGRNTNGAKVFGNLNATGTITSPSTVTGDNGSFGNICQSDSSRSVNIDGDLFIGPPAGRTITFDNATGLITTCGAVIVCNSCPSNFITICNCGALLNKGIIYGCNDIIAFSSSDKNLKENLNQISDTQNIINGIKGYTFDWNDKTEREGSDVGVIAQDVQKVFPNIVKEREDGYLAVDYIKLIPVLIEEVKRLNSEITELKEKIK